MRYKQTKTKTHKNQNGFASIIIALILIIVLSLITLAFAQMSRREQRSALSRQLATQAYYAAETGINDTLKILPGLTPAPDPNTCLNPTVSGLNPNIDATNGVSYSCILVDKTPGTLVKKPVFAFNSWYTTFSTNGALSSLTIKWNSSNPDPAYKNPRSLGDLGRFTPSGGGSGNWGQHPAVLEVSLTPLSSGSGRDALRDKTFTVFLYPSSGGGNSIGYSTLPNDQGQIISGSCTLSSGCSSTINNIGGALGDHYLAHIINYYVQSDLYIANAKDASGAALNFVDAQATIDATGKAHNVLKRLQVAIPINQPYNLPDYALEAQNLCKRFTTDPISGTVDNCTSTP